MNDKPAARRGTFLLVFILIVTALGIARCVNPSLTLSPIAGNAPEGQAKDSPSGREVQSPGPKAPAAAPVPDSIGRQSRHVDSLLLRPRARLTLLRPDGKPVKNRVTSVRRFETSFPDLNDVQLATAQRLGISHIENRDEAVRRLKELVYVGDTEGDCRQTHIAEMPFVFASYGFGHCDNADMTVGSFEELVETFDKIK